MNIRPHTLQKYLHSIAIDQLTEDYEAKGYEVFEDYSVSNEFTTDLFARKNGSGIIVGIKSGRFNEFERKRWRSISQFAKDNNYQFKLVIAGLPTKTEVHFPHAEAALDSYFKDDELRQIAEIAEKITYQRIDFVEITELHFREIGDIQILGHGDIEVELDFGDEISPDVFPFKFDIALAYNGDNQLKVKEIHKMEFDTYDYQIVQTT